MTQNRRIVLNIVATYGRSLYALVIGLFCGRWVYLSLGKIDYGLVGVVGGLVGFVTFFNSLMAGSVSRFYAFSVGQAQKEGSGVSGLEGCRKWFSIAVMIHTVLPIILMVAGYPIGEWAVRHYLTIPADRIEACVWVWRFTSLSCFVSMVSVPFAAMYNAKQEIAELTIYGFVTTTLNVLFGYYMITHPGVWIVKFAAWTCAMAILPQLIICIRAVVVYPECRFRLSYMREWASIRNLFGYSGSRFIVLFSQMLANNGIGVLVNKCLGPLRNAAMSVGSTVSWHCLTLSSSFSGAFSPAITNAAGAGDFEKMRKLAYATCRLSTVAVGIFALPMILEVDEILKLWLANPPEWAGALVVCMLICSMLDKISEGCWMSIFAIGRIAVFNAVESIFWFLILPIAYLFFRGRFDVVGAGLAFVCNGICVIGVKLYFGHSVAGLSVRHWLLRIFLPILVSFLCALVAGRCLMSLFAPSLARVVLTALTVEVVLLPLVWFFVLQRPERAQLQEKMLHRFNFAGKR